MALFCASRTVRAEHERGVRAHRPIPEPPALLRNRLPIPTSHLPAVMRLIGDQHVVSGPLCAFERVMQQGKGPGKIPPINANEPIAADR